MKKLLALVLILFCSLSPIMAIEQIPIGDGQQEQINALIFAVTTMAAYIHDVLAEVYNSEDISPELRLELQSSMQILRNLIIMLEQVYGLTPSPINNTIVFD